MPVRHPMSRGELDTDLTIKGNWTFTGVSAFSGNLIISDADLIITGATAANKRTDSHDDTDFNSVFANTTDWNISGITAIKAGTVDVDFDAITATSYGGTLEANLLDKSAAETIPGAYDFTTGAATIDTRHLIQGYTTGKSIIRCVRIRVQPGATPGTNLNITDVTSSNRGYNSVGLDTATNLAASGSSGDFDLGVGGKPITMTEGTVIGIAAAHWAIHNINNSSTSEIYVLDAFVTSGNLDINVVKRGSNSSVSWLSIMDAGDLADIYIIYVTSD